MVVVVGVVVAEVGGEVVVGGRVGSRISGSGSRSRCSVRRWLS